MAENPMNARVLPGCTRVQQRKRRAAVVLELILTLPVAVILIVATIEFGVLYANLQQLALASRVGAEEASQTISLQSAAAVPGEVVMVIERQLQSSNMSACHIRLEHNDGGPQQVLNYNPPAGTCNCEPTSLLVSPPPGEYVRVSVCVDLTLVTPNLLKTFGFDITGRTAQATTIMRYER